MAKSRSIALSAFAGIIGLFACWSMISPLFSAPDEESHVVWAAAMNAGTSGQTYTAANGGTFRLVTVPAVAAAGVTGPHGAYAKCFNSLDAVPATCAPALPTSTALVAAGTHSAEYPPMYYLAVGVPMAIQPTEGGLWAMRFIADFLVAIFLALSVLAIHKHSSNRFLWLGLLFGVTPQVIYLGGVINPSGLEIAASICFWVSAVILTTEWKPDPARGLLAILAFSGAVLVFCRSLSPIMAAAIGIVTLVQLPLKTWGNLLWHRRTALTCTMVLALASLGAVGWSLTHRGFKVIPRQAEVAAIAHSPFSDILLGSAKQLHHWMTESIGQFGWLTLHLPNPIYVGWMIAVVGLVLWGLVVGTWRQRLALLLVSVFAILGPVLLVASQARTLGYVWQGRDGMPILVGMPILAAGIIGTRSAAHTTQRRLSRVAFVVVPLVDLAAFFIVARRFSVGTSGPWSYFLHAAWQPILPELVLLAAASLFTLLLSAGLWRAVRQLR